MTTSAASRRKTVAGAYAAFVPDAAVARCRADVEEMSRVEKAASMGCLRDIALVRCG